MFCEPKVQELNTFTCSIYFVNFLTPLGPLGVRPYRFEQKWCPNRLCVPDPDGWIIPGTKMTNTGLFCVMDHQKSNLSLILGILYVGGC